MITPPTIPTLDDPKGLDKALLPIQAALRSGLSWLTEAYGKAERRHDLKGEGNRKYSFFFPAVYSGEGQYFQVLPNDFAGSFCFFDTPGRRDIDEVKGQSNPPQKSEIGLVFWFRFADVYPANHETRTVENVISDVLDVLTNTSFKVDNVRERAEEIYPGYTITEIDNQFLMRPYGGFRINGQLQTDVNC